MAKAEYRQKFEEHLALAENVKKNYPARQLHDSLAQLYYRLWEKAVM